VFGHAFRPRKNVIVPISNGSKAARHKVSVAPDVSPTFVMLSAIGVDDKPTFERYEICNPRTDRHLPAKLDIREASGSEESPKLLLSVRRATSKDFSELPLLLWHPAPHAPSPGSSLRSEPPSPTRGEGNNDVEIRISHGKSLARSRRLI